MSLNPEVWSFEGTLTTNDIEKIRRFFNEREVFKAAYLALRELAGHTSYCKKCIQMAAGGPACEVYHDCWQKCRAANELIAGKSLTAEMLGFVGPVRDECLPHSMDEVSHADSVRK